MIIYTTTLNILPFQMFHIQAATMKFFYEMDVVNNDDYSILNYGQVSFIFMIFSIIYLFSLTRLVRINMVPFNTSKIVKINSEEEME